jgi:phosphate transport system substrate-binding protein
MMKVTAYVMGAALAALLAAPAMATVTMKGSDTVLPLAQALAEQYQITHKGANVSVTGGGSGVGVTALINGTTDIADASRPLQPKEYDQAKGKGFIHKATRIAKDGICVIVNKSLGVSTLTMQQIGAIYSGRVSNWKDVGGPSKRIVVVGRDSSSGTYGFFKDTLFPGQPYRSDMLTMPSNNAIAQVVSRDDGAIGYIGLAYYEKWITKVKAVSVKEGAKAVGPSRETVSDGTYPLFRYLFMVTRGNARGEVGDFLKYAQSAAGQKIVAEVGYVPLR